MVNLDQVKQAATALRGVIPVTPLLLNEQLSQQSGAQVWLKREDLQRVRSYKIRGAFTKMNALLPHEKAVGIVCASAGNHAQGVAFACAEMGVNGTIFMPETTPKQKINQVKLFGKSWVSVELCGDTFDAAYSAALAYSEKNSLPFIHPFNDPLVIAGQGTIGLELLEQTDSPIDVVLVPIGGGGLAAGLLTVLKQLSPQTKVIGVEPAGAASMKTALQQGEVMRLATIDKFVDGAAVQCVGELTFEICKAHLDEIRTVPEGKVCATILRLYNEEALVVEPAGALTIAALEESGTEFAGKNVVCIVSGSNNDILRMPEIQERALLHAGMKHYFLIEFPQRPGALKTFVTQILGPDDDITYFQFSKKNNRESGPAVVGIELQDRSLLQPIFDRLHGFGFSFEYLNENFALYSQLIG